LSFPEARDRLLARIKEDNNFITTTDKRIKEIRKNIDNYEKKLREMDDDESNKKKSEEEKKKYEILY
jgi:intraflagellar transport protein 74